MPDHYRTLVQSLMQMGFLFRRVTERKEEVWRNRLTDQEVTFDRREVESSPAAAARAVKDAKNAKPGAKPAIKSDQPAQESPAAPARAVRPDVRTGSARRAKAHAKARRPAAKAKVKAAAAKAAKTKPAAKPKAKTRAKAKAKVRSRSR